jgi:hypothetical protein
MNSQQRHNMTALCILCLSIFRIQGTPQVYGVCFGDLLPGINASRGPSVRKYLVLVFGCI